MNGLFFVCFNRPSRHDQSAFSGDRMPGHAEACHPNGPYAGVRVRACADHRSSRRSSHLGSCRAVHMPKADHRRAEHRYFQESRVVPWILLFDRNRWVLRGMRTIPSQLVFQTRNWCYRHSCTSVLGGLSAVRQRIPPLPATGNGSILNDVRTDSCPTERIPVAFFDFWEKEGKLALLLTTPLIVLDGRYQNTDSNQHNMLHKSVVLMTVIPM